MIADSPFLSDLFKERRREQLGPANAFWVRHRKQKIRISIITAGEVLLRFENSATAWRRLEPWTICRLRTLIAN